MTVADGIEIVEQDELLVELGCDLGQGFLPGRFFDSSPGQLVGHAATD